jgi:hypothetical protein
LQREIERAAGRLLEIALALRDFSTTVMARC